MKIFVNENELDFSLENEKSLKEVMQYLLNWCMQQGFHIVNVQINQEQKYLEESLKSEIPLNQIEKLSLMVEDSFKVLEDIILTTKDYFLKMKDLIEKGEEELFKEKANIQEGLAWLREMGIKFFHEIKLPSNWIFVEYYNMADILEELTIALKDSAEFYQSDFFTLVKDMIMPHIEKLILGLQNALLFTISSENLEQTEAKSNFYSINLDSVDFFIEVGIDTIVSHFDHQEDKKAILSIQKVVYLFQFLEFSFSKLEAKGEIIEQKSEFLDLYKDILEELTQALEAKDFISVNDILLYKLSKILQDISNMFREKKKIY